MYLLNRSEATWPEPVEGRWFRQAQPTSLRFVEKIRGNIKKGMGTDFQLVGSLS